MTTTVAVSNRLSKLHRHCSPTRKNNVNALIIILRKKIPHDISPLLFLYVSLTHFLYAVSIVVFAFVFHFRATTSELRCRIHPMTLWPWALYATCLLSNHDFLQNCTNLHFFVLFIFNYHIIHVRYQVNLFVYFFNMYSLISFFTGSRTFLRVPTFL